MGHPPTIPYFSDSAFDMVLLCTYPPAMKQGVRAILWLTGALIVAYVANRALDFFGLDPLHIREIQW